MATYSKIHSLTSLRFFAAAMVVILHTIGTTGYTPSFKIHVLSQGVSFFFVLSGFILAYVYPSLDTKKAIGKFWLARWARIWPAHIVAFILVLLLVPATNWLLPTTDNKLHTTLANLFLVHGWIQSNTYYFSFNLPSWSISTELFFYLCFPLLIFRIKKTWWLKLTGAFLLLVFFIHTADQTRGYGLTYSMIYINPLARLFEFVLGMSVALAWERLRSLNITKKTGTFLEVVSLGLIIASLYFCADFCTLIYHQLEIEKNYSGNTSLFWLALCGSAPFFALLILVLALEKGYIARLLSLPFFIVLGEISFSVYLIHYSLLMYYIPLTTKYALTGSALWASYLGFWGILLLSSYIIWRFVEKPCRKLLLNLWPKTLNPPASSTSNLRETAV